MTYVQILTIQKKLLTGKIVIHYRRNEDHLKKQDFRGNISVGGKRTNRKWVGKEKSG